MAAAAIVMPPWYLLAALGALLALLVWLRFRRRVVRSDTYEVRRRALRKGEVHRPVFPPAERWRGERSGFRDSVGTKLWAAA